MAGVNEKSSSKQCSIYVIASKDAALADAECDRLLDKLVSRPTELRLRM
jgi:hypothetical protein